jgi:hypothetical protein
LAYSRCICVLSLPRSGSSTVAGMLHRLGVDMGEGHFQGHDDNNPRGYYEDLRFQELAKSLSGERYGTRKPAVIPEQTQRKYSALIAERATLPLWGFKSPRTVFVLQHILPLLKQAGIDTRFIIVVRDTAAIAGSLCRHSEVSYNGRFRMDQERAAAVVNVWLDALREAVELTDKDKTICVLYEEVLKNPQLAARRLADFAYSEMDTTATPEQIADAAAFVDGGLNHNGNSGSSTHA